MNIGRIGRRWGPVAFLVMVSCAFWIASQKADTDEFSTTAEVYDFDLRTPMLSARRVPRSLQIPVIDAELSSNLEPVLAGSPALSCLHVTVDGRTIVGSSDIAAGLIPASNTKIVSTWAALTELGDDFRFRTVVGATTTPDNQGILQGDLYLIGDGDPFLSTEQWWTQYEDQAGRFHTKLEDLADAVAATGLVEVTGSIVGDESRFDSERQGPWASRLIAGKHSGPLSALSVNEGFNDWPSPYVRANLRSETDNPPVHAVSIFAELLAERGVAVGRAVAGTAPAEIIELEAIESPPLSALVTHVNSYSSNFGAELIVKTLGSVVANEGTTRAGSRVVSQILADNGIPSEGLIIDDGSGLAESNRLTCGALGAILQKAGPDSVLRDSMAISATRGTLINKFVDTPAAGLIWAKTGTLRDTRALSGYAESALEPGSWATFAYIVNQELVPEDLFLTDSLVEALVNYPAGPTIEELSPLAPVRAG